MNLEEINSLFSEFTHGRRGIVGVASYRDVWNHVMPVQQKILREMGCGKSIIVLGVFHSRKAVESINIKKNGKTDYAAWNIYAREYHDLNSVLNSAARALADYVGGIPIPATLEGVASTIRRVEDYYALTVSQRVGAERSGLGWRGKNELIVTTKGCGLRLASVICPESLPVGTPKRTCCGTCTECLKVCSFLRKKHILKNYREQCRRFIVSLNLEGDVCGKCVKACYNHWIKE
jgi:epoxyqueuosine reductase QueG